ncbi:MAG: GNAT family protein [Pseudomonadota bacterium]
MFIRSERLFLRPGWPEDRRAIAALGTANANPRHSLADQWPSRWESAQAGAAAASDPRYPRFLVTLPTGDGSTIIGSLALTAQGTDAELSCAIAPDFRNRGYATEAVRSLAPLARILGHRRLIARHGADDRAAARMLRKAGYCPMISARAYLVHALDLARPDDCDGDDRVRRAA